MTWDDTFVYKMSKVTSDQMNAIIAKIKNILAEDLIFSDSTVGDVSTSMHGFFPKFPGGSNYLRADGEWTDPSTTTRQTLFLSCAEGFASTTNGDSGFVTIETANGYEYRGVSMVRSAGKFHNWNMIMPSNYKGGTIIATPVFLPTTSDANNHTVVLKLQGGSFASTEAKNGTMGTAVASTYIMAADNSAAIIFGPATTAITLQGSPASGEFVCWRTYRDTDTYTGAIILLGWELEYMS